MATRVGELANEKEWLEGYKVMHELRTHLSESEYLDLMQAMVKQGYQMFALYDENEIVAVTGIIELINFYNHKHIYVYDLVTKKTARSKGYGMTLLTYIHELAHARGCNSVALSSGLQRKDAHRFYEEKMGYRKTSYGFVYTL
jgi:GNAT superfamily N-acetyltransferase